MITKEQVEAAEKRIAEAEEAIKEDKELIKLYKMQTERKALDEFADIINRNYANQSGYTVTVLRLETRWGAPQYNGMHRPASRNFEFVLHCSISR